jgi:hypothetical protein
MWRTGSGQSKRFGAPLAVADGNGISRRSQAPERTTRQLPGKQRRAAGHAVTAGNPQAAVRSSAAAHTANNDSRNRAQLTGITLPGEDLGQPNAVAAGLDVGVVHEPADGSRWPGSWA